VQDYEDKTNEATMILEANADILTSLRDFYERLVNNKDFTVGGTSSEDVADFTIQLKDMSYDLRMQIARGKLLAKVIADRKTLVSILYCRILPVPFIMLLSSTKPCLDPAAPSESSNRENGNDDKYVPKRSGCGTDYHSSYSDLSSGDLRFGKSRMPLRMSHQLNYP
jgi:hypothetical protein